MGVFRCPSPSDASSNASIPEPSVQSTAKARPIPGSAQRRQRMQRMAQMTVHGAHEDTRKLHRTDSGKHRSGIDLAKKKRIEAAKKKERLRLKLKKRDFSFVFVGNLAPTVEEEMLRKHFHNCGPMERVVVRCSRGAAESSRRPSGCRRSVRDRRYATIEFRHGYSIKNALANQGSVLEKLPLVVCLSAAELPEVQDIVHRRVTQIRERHNIPGPSNANAKRPIVLENTHIIPPPRTDSSNADTDSHRKAKLLDRINFMGFSWPKTLM